MFRSILYIGIIIFLGGRFISCKPETNSTNSTTENAVTYPGTNPDIGVATPEVKTTIIAVDGGWGYDVSLNGQPYIHQVHIPAINGNHVFISEQEAQQVADIVAQKIQNNEMPPSVSIEELQQLNITIK